MVKKEYDEKYECPICGVLHGNNFDALHCCENDVKVVYKNERFYCEYCGKRYLEHIHAENCEERHETNQDKYYETIREHLSRQRLKVAASHPTQTKIV